MLDWVRFQDLLHSGHPDMSGLGFTHLNIVAQSAFYNEGDDTTAVPSDTKLTEVATGALAHARPLCVNLEQWAGDSEYITTAANLQNVAPDLRFGYYSILPKRDYWRAQEDRTHADYLAWQSENDARAEIAEHVDALFPSLYTFNDNVSGWRRYAQENIREARRLARGKPVYAFLWPQYHDSSDFAYQLIDGPFWRVQLDTLQGLVDGVVIWGGYTTDPTYMPLAWDENAPWWVETKDFFGIA